MGGAPGVPEFGAKSTAVWNVEPGLAGPGSDFSDGPLLGQGRVSQKTSGIVGQRIWYSGSQAGWLMAALVPLLLFRRLWRRAARAPASGA